MTAETDYLIVGAGAVGLAFADTLLAETDAHLTIVDREVAPGGHWNHAYPFVALHQPSIIYGVNSVALGTGAANLAVTREPGRFRVTFSLPATTAAPGAPAVEVAHA